MVLNRSSQPSSNSTSPVPNLNGSPPTDPWTDQGSGDLIAEGAPTGYVLLGSETVQNAMDRDSEVDDDSETDVPEARGDAEASSLTDTEPVESIAEQALANMSEQQLDRLLCRQLNSSDLEPRGVFGDPSLYTDPLRDTFQASLWNEPLVSSASEIPITDEKADEIKNCMSKIQIPVSQFPPWVTQIPENQWKAKLLETLSSKKKM